MRGKCRQRDGAWWRTKWKMIIDEILWKRLKHSSNYESFHKKPELSQYMCSTLLTADNETEASYCVWLSNQSHIAFAMRHIQHVHFAGMCSTECHSSPYIFFYFSEVCLLCT